METIRKHIFWVATGVLLVGTGVFWALGVLARQGELRTVRQAYEEKQKALGRLADRKTADLVNSHDVEQLKLYLGELDKIQLSVRQELKAVNINIDAARFAKRPPTEDLTRFQSWLQEQYEQRCEQARLTGLEFACERDGEHPELHGDFKLEALTLEKIPLVLKRFVISCIVHRILAEALVRVRALDMNVDTSEERETTAVRGVDALRRLEFFDTPLEAERKRGKGRATSSQPLAMPQPPIPEPFKRHVFQLEFVAHYSVVPQVLKALVESREMFLVLSCLDIYRYSERVTRRGTGFGGDTVASTGTTTTLTARERRFMNQRYNEAPVVVFVECEVLEFEFPKEG